MGNKIHFPLYKNQHNLRIMAEFEMKKFKVLQIFQRSGVF